VESCSKAVFVRDKSSANMDKFLENLQNVNWSHVNGYADPQQCYSRFVHKYTEIYDNCFPYKKIKRSDRRLNKPWISLQDYLNPSKGKISCISNIFLTHLTIVKCTVRDTKISLTTA